MLRGVCWWTLKVVLCRVCVCFYTQGNLFGIEFNIVSDVGWRNNITRVCMVWVREEII